MGRIIRVTAQAGHLKVPGTYRTRQKTQSLPVTKSYGMTRFRQKCQAPEQLLIRYQGAIIRYDHISIHLPTATTDTNGVRLQQDH